MLHGIDVGANRKETISAVAKTGSAILCVHIRSS
jgi:hypothetical protein